MTGNEDYVPPEELVLVYNDLALLGLQNLWHGFLLLSLLDLVDEDIILSRRKVVWLIKLLVMQLHRLWIQWCSIIHTKVLDETTFEKLNSLREEVNEIIYIAEYSNLVESKIITGINDI